MTDNDTIVINLHIINAVSGERRIEMTDGWLGRMLMHILEQTKDRLNERLQEAKDECYVDDVPAPIDLSVERLRLDIRADFHYTDSN